MPTVVARLTCDESTARRVAALVGESLLDETACAAFEAPDGQWRVELHFRDGPDRDGLRALVEAAGADTGALTFDTVAERDWVETSLAGLTPVMAGRFVVHGAHDRGRIAPNAIGIEIEAALAFGTGHHGTTRGCLLALDQLAKRRRFRRVLDIGTGTGVLAIAAARRWRATVTATDIDLAAVNAARANHQLNRAAPWIKTIRADGVRARAIRRHGPFDLIAANILLGPLRGMATPLTRLTAPGSVVVLSGLLASHAATALAVYRARGLVLDRRILLDGWATLVLRRPAK